MGVRTTVGLVKGVLLDEYGPRRDGSLPDLYPFVEAASNVTDRLRTLGLAAGYVAGSTELELIERWLAAHFYKCAPDQMYSSNRTLSASAVYSGRTGEGLNSTKFGQTALTLDGSGLLATLSRGMVAIVEWAGHTDVVRDNGESEVRGGVESGW